MSKICDHALRVSIKDKSPTDGENDAHFTVRCRNNHDVTVTDYRNRHYTMLSFLDGKDQHYDWMTGGLGDVVLNSLRQETLTATGAPPVVPTKATLTMQVELTDIDVLDFTNLVVLALGKNSDMQYVTVREFLVTKDD